MSNKKTRSKAPRLEAKSLIFVIAILVVLVVAGNSFANPTLPASGSKIPGKYIVMFKNTTTDDPEMVAKQNGITPDHKYQYAIKGFAGSMTPAQVTALRNNPKIQSVEEDLYINLEPDPEKGLFSFLARGGNGGGSGNSNGNSIKVEAPKGGQKPKDRPVTTVPPVANFTATPLTGVAPLEVSFTDTSSKSPTAWSWDFDNNGTVDSTEQNPIHIYSSEGTYSVKLTASNPDGSDSEIKMSYVTAGTEPAPGDCLAVINGTQQLGWGVNRIDAEQNAAWATCDGGEGIGVAVLDTGIDLDHPDLVDGIVASVDFTGKGTAEDGHGHGTHVAGIIGARRNSIGYVGVAPKSSIAAVKVLSDTGSGSISAIVSGINWAIANKATYNLKVINMSLGGSGTSSSLQTAVNNATTAGIAVVAAAGNSASDAATFIPAAYTNSITISSMTSSGTFASYSNYGSVIDFIAPGSSIPSAYKNGAYASMSGTSMAAPHAAGAFALWFDNHSGTVAEARAAVLSHGQSGTWTGDPDGISEPMVYASGL